MGGVHSNLIGQKLASLASYLNRGCYCILRRNGRVLLPSFASCIDSSKSLSYLLFKFLLHISQGQGPVDQFPVLTQKEVRPSGGVRSLDQLATNHQWKGAFLCCLSPFPLAQIGTKIGLCHLSGMRSLRFDVSLRGS